MRSLLLKDLYNIGHNAKQMLFLLLFLAVCLIPSTGAEGFIITSAIMCSMMTVTTFSFDERCKWEKYALIMPITRKEYVLGKYVVNMVFITVGILFGIITAVIFGMIKGNFKLLTVMGSVIAALFIALLYGSIIIPLIIKFGTESARMIMIGTLALPTVIAFGLYQLAKAKGISFDDSQLAMVLGAAGIAIVIFAVASFAISVKWYENKEL